MRADREATYEELRNGIVPSDVRSAALQRSQTHHSYAESVLIQTEMYKNFKQWTEMTDSQRTRSSPIPSDRFVCLVNSAIIAMLDSDPEEISLWLDELKSLAESRGYIVSNYAHEKSVKAYLISCDPVRIVENCDVLKATRKMIYAELIKHRESETERLQRYSQYWLLTMIFLCLVYTFIISMYLITDYRFCLLAKYFEAFTLCSVIFSIVTIWIITSCRLRRPLAVEEMTEYSKKYSQTTASFLLVLVTTLGSMFRSIDAC